MLPRVRIPPVPPRPHPRKRGWGRGVSGRVKNPDEQSESGLKAAGALATHQIKRSTASHPGLAVAQRRQSLPFEHYALLNPTSSPTLDRQPFDHPLDLPIPITPLMISARMFFIFKG